MGKIAFVFSGQGSQYTGMGKELYESSKAAKEIFDMADKIRKNTSYQCFNASKEELSQTINTQPALFCVDLAAAAALKENGVNADMAAGFSLGEIPALAFSGALSYEEGFRLVCKRAELMNEVSKESKGEMAAIVGLTSERIEKLCKSIENTYPVNYNCASQTVVAGSPEGIETLSQAVKEEGGKAIKLAVSGAFHSPYMTKASEMMTEYLKDIVFNGFDIPVYANSTAQIYDDKITVAKQINNPVQWNNTIINMLNEGADTFIEVGAGKVLSGLLKKISKEQSVNISIYNVEDDKSLKEVLDAIKG